MTDAASRVIRFLSNMGMNIVPCVVKSQVNFIYSHDAVGFSHRWGVMVSARSVLSRSENLNVSKKFRFIASHSQGQ